MTDRDCLYQNDHHIYIYMYFICLYLFICIYLFIYVFSKINYYYYYEDHIINKYTFVCFNVFILGNII